MGKPKRRFVARGVPGGWIVWDNKLSRQWGELYELQPDELVTKLNGAKRTEILALLTDC